MSMFRNILIQKTFGNKYLEIPLTFEALQNKSKISISDGRDQQRIDIYYNIDNLGWKTYDFNNVITLSCGQTISFKSTRTWFNDDVEVRHIFSMTGSFKAYGNIMSLVNYIEDFSIYYETGCFMFLFEDCTSLLNIDNLILPAKTIPSYAYYGMFYGCSNLSNIPKNLINGEYLMDSTYAYMFERCTGIENVSEKILNNIQQFDWSCYNISSCCRSMFSGCSNLSINNIYLQNLNEQDSRNLLTYLKDNDNLITVHCKDKTFSMIV